MKLANLFSIFIVAFLIFATVNGKSLKKRDVDESYLTESDAVLVDPVNQPPLVTPRPQQNFWSRVNTFVSGVADRGQRFLNNVLNRNNNGSRDGGDWKETVNREMSTVFNSMARMWEGTVKALDKWRESVREEDDTIWKRMSTSIKEVETELKKMWDSRVQFVSLENSTRVPLEGELIEGGESTIDRVGQFMSNQSQKVSSLMSDVWSRLNNNQHFNFSSLSNLPSVNRTQVDGYLLEMQSKVNKAWQRLTNQMKANSSGLEREESDASVIPEAITNEVEKMNRMQRDVEAMYKAIRSAPLTDEDTTGNESQVENRIKTVWNNLKSFVSDQNNDSTISGMFRSANERLQRMGDFFTNLTRSGQEQLSSQGGKVEALMSRLSETFRTISDAVTGKQKTILEPTN